MVTAWFKKVDSWILPRGMKEQFSPYIWLAYLPLFFVPVFMFDDNVIRRTQVVVISLVFIFVYFASFWSCSRRSFFYIGAMCALGTAASLITPSASTLFIYAAALCSRLSSTKSSFIALAAVLAWIAVISFTFNLSINFYGIALIFSAMVGAINIYQYSLHQKQQELILSRQETQQLAKIAERERIARDLHDLIGHTFSVITLKADLAGRLIDKNSPADIANARAEVQQLEDISRSALSQVREVVSGYRSSDLMAELANAKHVFVGVGIDFSYAIEQSIQSLLEANPQVNKELAIVVRELVTNVIKHAHASKVELTITQNKEAIVFEMHDNGRGFTNQESAGFGLIGIKERMEKIHAQVNIGSEQDGSGASAHIQIPINTLTK